MKKKRKKGFVDSTNKYTKIFATNILKTISHDDPVEAIDEIILTDKSRSGTRGIEVNLLAMSSKVSGIVDSNTSIDQLPRKNTMNFSNCEKN